MSYSVSIEIDDNEYEVEVNYIDFGQAPSGWDPGAGGEIELDPQVWVWKSAGKGYIRDRKISMDEFLEIYAEFEQVDKKAAERKLEEYCFENVRGQMEDDYDDSDV